MKAKAYLITALVIDFEGMAEEDVIDLMEGVRHLSPTVVDTKAIEIEEWDDDHILNKSSTTPEQIREQFGIKSPIGYLLVDKDNNPVFCTECWNFQAKEEADDLDEPKDGERIVPIGILE